MVHVKSVLLVAVLCATVAYVRCDENVKIVNVLRNIVGMRLKAIRDDFGENFENRQDGPTYDDLKCMSQLNALMNGLNTTEMWAIRGE